MGTAITIGDAAAATGLTPKAIRLYELRGLVEPAGRTAAGYRTFSEDALRRLRFIAASRRLGLHLDQIAEILEAADAGRRPCGIAQELLDQRIGEVDRVMEELSGLREVLLAARLSKANDSTDSFICPVIETGATSAAL